MLGSVGYVHVRNYLPGLEEQLQRMVNHARLQGVSEGLAVAEKVLIWLTAKPRLSHEKLAEYVRAEVEQVEKRALSLL